MRAFAYSLVAVLLAGQPAFAAPHCPTQADASMFDVESLKSELMVLATTCHVSTGYNAFIGRYQPELVRYDQQLEEYFKHHYGRNAAREHDAYITALANGQSTTGLRQGTDFCDRNETLFNEVMSLRSPADLPAYAAAKDLMPEDPGACVGPAPPPVKAQAPKRPAAPAKKTS